MFLRRFSTSPSQLCPEGGRRFPGKQISHPALAVPTRTAYAPSLKPAQSASVFDSIVYPVAAHVAPSRRCPPSKHHRRKPPLATETLPRPRDER